MILLMIIAGCALSAAVFYRWQARALRACLRQHAGGRIAEIIKKPGDYGGYKAIVTTIFTDISSFAQISEGRPADDIGLLVQEIFRPAMKVIQAEGGEVDKTVGDALMYRHTDAEKAVEMAELVTQELEKAAGAVAAKLKCPKLKLTTGLHTGEVFTGQVGLPGFFVDYTTIGENVNLASRVQGLCKFYGVPVLLTGPTYNYAGRPGAYKLLDVITVKGCEQAIDIYAKSSHFTKWLEFEKARKMYVDGDFAKAKQAFMQAGAGFEMWAWRCEQLEKNPPAQWKGVWKFNQK